MLCCIEEHDFSFFFSFMQLCSSLWSASQGQGGHFFLIFWWRLKSLVVQAIKLFPAPALLDFIGVLGGKRASGAFIPPLSLLLFYLLLHFLYIRTNTFPHSKNCIACSPTSTLPTTNRINDTHKHTAISTNTNNNNNHLTVTENWNRNCRHHASRRPRDGRLRVPRVHRLRIVWTDS